MTLEIFRLSLGQPLADNSTFMPSMPHLPRFAVLLAAYNGGPWIAEQVSSILAQEQVEVVVFISVDQSTDDTYLLCQSLARYDSRIVLLPSIGRFGSAGKNFYRLIRDVNFSGYKYIALADQDDLWLKDKLWKAHEILVSGNCSAYSGNAIAFWPDGRRLLINKAQPQCKYDFLFEGPGPGCTYVIRVQEALQFKYFLMNKWLEVNEVSLHDWIIYAWFRANEFAWYIDRTPRVLYRQHSRNHVGANIGLNAAKNRIELIRSGWYRSEVTKIWKIVGHLLPEFPSNIFIDRGIARLSSLRYINNFRRRVRDRVYLFLIILLGVY